MKTYLGAAQEKALLDDRAYLLKQMDNPLVQDKPAVRKQLRRVEHDLETQAPPELKGVELDKEVRLEKELREEIVPNMPSQEEMRKAPSGSIGRHMAFEKEFKEKILRWKNAMRTIHRGSDDPDVSNIERFRPTVSQHNMHGALIPGQDFNFPSKKFVAGYDQIDWSTRLREPGEDIESYESRIRRERLAEMRAQTAALEAEIEAENAAAEEESPPRLGLDGG